MKVRSFNGSAEDDQLIRKICFGCGSKAIQGSRGFIQRMCYLHPNEIIFDIFDDKAFFFGWRGRQHVRCIAIAVLEEFQHDGIGKEIIFFETQKAVQLGINKMTLRTSKIESGVNFWLSVGTKIVGEKDLDWEMLLQF